MEMAANFSKNGIIQGVIDFFCLVCETNILSTAECEAHMHTAEHEKNFSITAYDKEFKEDCIRKIKNKYFCELCNKFLPLLPRVRLHVKDPKHKDNKNIGWLKRVDGAIVAFNELVIDDTAWHGFSDESCIICNTECDDNEIHKKLPSHILNLLQMKVDFDKDKNIYRKIDEFSFQCLICNVIQNVTDVTNHFDSPTHQHLLQISYKTYELSKVCTKLNCEGKYDINKSVQQSDVCLYSNNQVHVENFAETKQHIPETIAVKLNEKEATEEERTKNIFKYTFGDICEEELFKILKVEQTNIPSYSQVDIKNPAEIEQTIPETIKLESKVEHIETKSKNGSKNAAEDITRKVLKYTFGDICEEELLKILKVKADVCLLLNNQVDTENPAETEQNITDTIKLESNEKNTKTNTRDGSNHESEEIRKKVFEYTFGDIHKEELLKILKSNACTKSNYKAKDSVNKSDKLTVVCLPSKNQVDVENPTKIEQKFPENIELELNEDNIKTDGSKSNCESKNNGDKSNEKADACLPSKNQVDVENPAKLEQKIPETIELELNEDNIKTDGSKSNCESKDNGDKSNAKADVCLPSKNQVDVENPAEKEQKIYKTIKLELSEDNIETDSSRSNSESKESVDKSDEQTDVCLPLKNQADIEIPAETEYNNPEAIVLEPNKENIETNSKDGSKSYCESKNDVSKSDQQSDVCLPSNNHVYVGIPAATKYNNPETIVFGPNKENIETNSKDSSKSYCEPNNCVSKSDEQYDICLLSNNHVGVDTPAETEHSYPETIILESNEENIETNRIDSSKLNYEPKDGIIKSVELTDACLPLNNQVDIVNPAETKQNITEIGKTESHEENIETNSIDISKLNYDSKDSVDKSDLQTDVYLHSNNQVDIENPVETKQNNSETFESNQDNIETDSSKSNCKSKHIIDKSDEQTDVCLHLNNQVDIENPAETEHNNPETIELEPNEKSTELNSSNSSKSIYEPKHSINKSDKQSDVCLLSNNQVDVENPAEIEQNIPETIELDPTKDNIETNSNNGSKDTPKNVFEYDYISEEEINIFLKENVCVKSNSEPKNDFNESVEQIDVRLPLDDHIDIESPAETEQKIPEIMEFELNDENIETNSKDGSKDAREETIKSVIEYKFGDICKKEIFEVLEVNDYYTLEEYNKSWCFICNWIVDSSTVEDHLNGRHHKLQKLHKKKAKRSCKKHLNPKHFKENNNTNDCHEEILNSESNNNTEISLGMKTAFCKKCLVNLYYDNNDVIKHIIEHLEKDKNIGEETIIFTTLQEPVNNETLSSNSVLPEGNEIENNSKLNGNESVKIHSNSEKTDKLREVQTQITEEKFSIQQTNKFINKIEKIPTHCFIDYIIYAKNSLQGINFCDIIINKSIYMNYTSFSFITVHRDCMKCHACDEIFTIYTLEEHYMSTKHDVAMRDTPVLILYDSEFIREIRPGYFHCGYCNAIESMDGIETHLNSVNHKECKGVASWRLQLYQPLIDKTGFQTVYAKYGISRALSLRNV